MTKNSNRNNSRGSMVSMQTLVETQVALNQQMVQTLQAIEASTDMMNYAVQAIPEVAPGYGRNSRQYSGGPNGGRPTIGDDQSRRPDHGAGFSGIRQAVARAGEGRFGGSSGSRFVAQRDQDGNLLGHHEISPDGRRQFRDINGPKPVSDAELAAAGQRGAVSNVLSKVAGGAGATTILRAVPYVGGAVIAGEAITQGLHLIGREREANSQYQSIYGGSNWGTGFHNRRLQEGFKLSQMFSGGLTGKQADEAFRGVSTLGFSGSQRSQDLNFITSNYKKLGMDVADSLKLITDASKDFNTQLAGLKDGLKDVTAAAKATGQNAGAMRQQLIQNNAVLGSTFLGPGAGQLAANISVQQAKLGRGLQGIDVTGALTSTSQLAVLGAYTGKTPTQLRAMISKGGSQMYGLLDYQIGRAVQGSATANVKTALNNYMQKNGMTTESLKKHPEQLEGIAQYLESMTGGINTDTLAAAFAASGIQVNPQQAGLYFTAALTGVANYKGVYDENQPQRTTSTKVLHGSGHDADRARAGLKSGDKTYYGSDASQTLTAISAGEPKTHGRGSAAARTATVSVVNDPVIKDALSKFKGVKVAVTTKGGQQIVTDIETAAKDFRDQIAMGTATIVSGQYANQTIQDALGGESESNYYTSGGENSSNITADAWLKTHDGKKSKATSLNDYRTAQNKKDGVTGTVTIEPSDALKQLLSFTPTGNVRIAYNGAANGSTALPGS